MKIRITLIKISTCVPWEFKLLCNRITARRATKTTQNPAADFYTISVRQLSNRRWNFKVWSKERVEPKPKVFRCFNHRALIEVTAFVTWPRGATRVGIKVCFAHASNSNELFCSKYDPVLRYAYWQFFYATVFGPSSSICYNCDFYLTFER